MKKRQYTRWTKEHDELAVLAVQSQPGITIDTVMREVGWRGHYTTAVDNMRRLAERGKLSRVVQKGVLHAHPWLFFPPPEQAKGNGAAKAPTPYVRREPAPEPVKEQEVPMIVVPLPNGTAKLTVKEAKLLYVHLKEVFG